MNRTTRFLVAAALAFSVAAIAVSSAFAHARPVRFDPAPGVVLTSSPSQITGWFSSDIRREASSFIHVIDSSKQRVDTGDAILSSDRRQMSVNLRPGLPDGRYIVHWSTLDDGDGDTLSGCYVYFVGQTAADRSIQVGEPLDGGSLCPAVTEAAAATPEPGESMVNTGGDADSSGVPVWTLAIALIGGIAVGGLGVKLVSGRA